MEMLPSKPSGPVSQRRRDSRQRGHGSYRQHSQVNDRGTRLPTAIRHLKENDRPLRALGEGPVPRSKEKNDEFIQSWLKQTQAHHARLPEMDQEKGRHRLADQSRSRAVADRHRKRPRSLSKEPPPSPKAAEQVEYRFEKRARHRTRDDKYDYKARGVKPRRVSDQEFPEYGTHEAERVQGAKRKHSTRHKDPAAVASHMLRRASRPPPKAHHISQSLTRRASEPNTKSKLNKSQKEDKELEELSAFFSRRRSHDKTEPREYRVANHGDHLRGLHLGTESHSRVSYHGRYGSPHGSQQSYRFEGEGTPRYSSSLPAIRSRDSGPDLPSRLSSKPKSGDPCPQQDDDDLLLNESGSYYSGRARSRRSTTTRARGALGQHGRYEPAAEAEPERRSPAKVQGFLRGACKDAAAQTNLTPGRRDRPPKQPEKLDETQLSRNGSWEDPSRYNAVVSSMATTHQAPQLSADRVAKVWQPPELSRYAAHVGLSAGYQRFDEEAQTYGLDAGLAGTQHAFGKPGMPGREAGSLLHPPPLPVGHRSNANEHSYPYQNQHMDYPGTIPGNFGIENLEEFIRRIEGEAVLPREEVEDTRARPYSELEVLEYPEPSSLALPQIANFAGADDAAILSNRDWFALEGDLPAPIPAGDAARSAQDASFDFPTSVSMLELYARKEHEGYQTDTGQQRNLF